MAADGGLTAVALSAFFGLCVPATSQGKLEQTLPSALMVPLYVAEQVEYADAIKGGDRAYRVKSDAGFILLTTKGGACRVIIGEGDTDAAIDQFRQKLRAAHGREDKAKMDDDGYFVINGVIPLTEGDAVALVFTTRRNSKDGFFASAFGVHKK